MKYTMDTTRVSKILGVEPIGVIDVSIYEPMQKGVKGIFHPFYGKKQSDHQKEVVRENMKKNNPMFNKVSREKMRLKQIGKKRTAKGLLQSSNLMKKLNSILKTCQHCDRSFYNQGAFNRWHGDKCKEAR